MTLAADCAEAGFGLEESVAEGQRRCLITRDLPNGKKCYVAFIADDMTDENYREYFEAARYALTHFHGEEDNHDHGETDSSGEGEDTGE